MLSNYKFRAVLLAISSGIVFCATQALGQIAVGTIQGKVTDATGNAVVGATVTASSPALQLSKVTATSDSAGDYELRNLPAPGVYSVQFEASGFQRLVRENLNLPVGFSARVDAPLQVGAVTQSVEVTGASPVVDTENPGRSLNIPLDELQNLPRGGGMQEMYTMAEGVTVAGKPDVADSNLGQRAGASTYGAPLEPSIRLEGMDLEDGDHGNDTGMYFSGYDFSEAEFKTTGQAADVGKPGFDMETVIKSGSNTFHGAVFAEYENSVFQSNNVTPALSAQGIKVTNPLVKYYTYTGELGGRIIRDRLWFYGGLSRQYQNTGQISFVAGPDANGCWTCGDAPPAFLINMLPQYNGKFNYQARKNLAVNFIYTRADKSSNAFNASSTVPLPSSEVQYQTVYVYKGELQWTFSPHGTMNVIAGTAYSLSHYTAEPGTEKAGQPSSEENSTGLTTGPISQVVDRPSTRHVIRGNVAYFLGTHQFKLGADTIPSEGRATDILHDSASGDYLLIFNKGLPFEVSTYNYPVTQTNAYNAEALYAMDTWKFKRFALSYGVRWDRYDSGYAAQTKPLGELSPQQSFPGQNIYVFNDFVPRVGVAWDVFGRGKTVAKFGYGRFGDTMESAYAGDFNPNGIVTTTYTWPGPCVNTGFNNVSYNMPNTSCDIVQSQLLTLATSTPAAGYTFVSATGGLNQIVNPNLSQPKINNYTARIEQQLVPNVALTVGFVLDQVLYLSPYSGTTGNTIFPNRPYSAYSVVVPLVDPVTGQTVNIYSYPSSYAVAADGVTEYVSAPGSRPNNYTTWEFGITKRYSKRWNASASFWTTKNDAWITAVPSNPNLVPFALDETRHWQALGSTTYSAPWGIHTSGYFRGQSGTPGQRTVNFTKGTASGTSSPLLLQGTVSEPMEALGAEQGPAIPLMDLEVGKTQKFGKDKNQAVELNYESYNLFNSSAATSSSYLTGTTFGRVTGIVSPRIGRFSLRYSF